MGGSSSSFNAPYSSNVDSNTLHETYWSHYAYVDVRGNHAKPSRSHSSKSMVLLKNNSNTLPLDKPHKVAIFGSHARAAVAGPSMAFSVEGSGPTYDGHLATDSGSGQGSLPYLITPETSLTIKASQDGTMLRWVANDTLFLQRFHAGQARIREHFGSSLQQ